MSAHGNVPDDRRRMDCYLRGRAQQFKSGHGVRVSDDGLVYGGTDEQPRAGSSFDRLASSGAVMFIRTQEPSRWARRSPIAFLARTLPSGQCMLALAAGGSRYPPCSDRRGLARKLDSFGRIGHCAGEFVFLHSVATD